MTSAAKGIGRFFTEEMASGLQLSRSVSTSWQSRKVLLALKPHDSMSRLLLNAWVKVVDQEKKADCYVLAHNTTGSVSTFDVAEAFLREVNKPVIVQIGCGNLTEQLMNDLRDKYLKIGVRGFLFANGRNPNKALNEHMGLSVEESLDIFSKCPQEDLLLGSCLPIPSISPKVTQESAMNRLAKLVEKNCTLLVLSSWSDPQSTMPYLQAYMDTKGDLPVVVQEVCPVETKEQWHEIKRQARSISASVSKKLDRATSNKKLREISKEQQLETLSTVYSSSPKGLVIAGAFANTHLVKDEERLNSLILRMKGLDVASHM